jgi:hypothetical protein
MAVATEDRWVLITETALLEALNHAHDGDEPDLIYAELWANSADGEDWQP